MTRCLAMVLGSLGAELCVVRDTFPTVRAQAAKTAVTHAQQAPASGALPTASAAVRAGAETANPTSFPFLPSGVPVPPIVPRLRGPQADGADLALGRPYRVRSAFPDPYWRQAEAAYPDKGQLTDGKLGTLDFTDPAWAGFQYQYGHTVVVDLGHPCHIRACSLDFLQSLGAGVVLPATVRYAVSQDGRRWASVGGAARPGASIRFAPQSEAFEVRHLNVNARYVRAEFDNQVWGFIDEFSVFGSAKPSPHAPYPVGSREVTHERGYVRCGDGTSAGIRNMLVVYTGGHGSLGAWQAAEFLPLIRPVATRPGSAHALFDTVLFMPYPLPASVGAWAAWLDDLFAPGRQLHALDAAMAQSAATAPGSPATERIVIAVPSISDPDGFGVPLPGPKAAALHGAGQGTVAGPGDKQRVIDWYLTEVMRRWQQAGFHHLRLVGMQWQPESVSIVDPVADQALIRRTADGLHALHLRFVWIPFYGAVGLLNWRQLGFDLVLVQPNVSFQWSAAPQTRLATVDRLARRYGTGIEMEAHWDVTSRYRLLAEAAQRRFAAYFESGCRLGYGGPDVVKAWYMNSKTMIDAYASPDPFYRRLYDWVLAFVRGSLQPRDFHV